MTGWAIQDRGEAMMCRFGVPLGPVAEPVDGPWARGVDAVAQEAGVAVIAGMFTPADDGRVDGAESELAGGCGEDLGAR